MATPPTECSVQVPTKPLSASADPSRVSIPHFFNSTPKITFEQTPCFGPIFNPYSSSSTRDIKPCTLLLPSPGVPSKESLFLLITTFARSVLSYAPLRWFPFQSTTMANQLRNSSTELQEGSLITGCLSSTRNPLLFFEAKIPPGK